MINRIGKKLYFDKSTGEVLAIVSERTGVVIETTAEQDRETFVILSERLETSYDYIQLEYGQYDIDFVQAVSYKIDVDTKEIIFTYREVNEDGEEEEVTPTKPLSIQIKELEAKANSQEKAIAELTELMTFSMMGM